jgi:hypothetical protein
VERRGDSMFLERRDEGAPCQWRGEGTQFNAIVVTITNDNANVINIANGA